MDEENINNNRNEQNSAENKSCLLDHVDISVPEAEKRTNGALNIREYYTVYLVETKVKNPKFKKLVTKLGTIWRRYTEFEVLRSYLEVTYPFIVLPPLPEKKLLYTWQKSATDTFDPDFIDRRRQGLEIFLLRIAAHPILSGDQLFLGFLQQETGWRETCKETGYLQLSESKIKSLTTLSVRLKRPDERFEAIKEYSSELNQHLGNILRIRAKLAERLFTLHKLHANYGRVFSEWSAVEKTMGDGLQKTGHYLDSIAASIDSLLEEEELIADQLKEYLFYSQSIQNVCKRHDLLQIQLEKAVENLQAKNNEKDQVQKGKSGIMSRLFGTVDTEEVRDVKVNVLEQRIQEEQLNVQAATEELNDFSAGALSDYERFQNQKAADLKNVLTSYVELQVKIARQGLQTWTHIKNCLENIP